MNTHLANEIRACIETNDLVKLRAVIENGQDLKPRRVSFEINRAEAEIAIPILAALASRFPQETRITTTLITRAGEASDQLETIATTMTPSERKTLAQNLKLQKQPLPPLLASEIDADESGNGLPQPGTELAFEEMEQLATKKTGDPDWDRQIQDVIDEALFLKNAYQLTRSLDSGHVDIRVNTKTLLVNMDEQALPALHEMLNTETPKDSLIHAINVIGLIASAKSITPLRNFLFSESPDPNVRFAAYESLGQLPLGNQVHALIAGLEDPDESVRLAVVRAVEKSSDPRVIEGLGRIIDQKGQQALEIISLILNGECAILFFAFLDNDFFKRLAYSMLKTRCHITIVEFFDPLLRKRGLEPVEIEASSDNAPLVYAVDDSRMILMIYRKILHKLGYRCQTFESPKQALAALSKEPPALVFTDLNMINANGIDLAKDLRKQFTQDQMPIYMVTTQDESPDFSEAYAAGISKVINKPFTSQDLETVLRYHFDT